MRLIDGDYVRDEILYGDAYVSDELAVYIKREFDNAPTIDPENLRSRGKWIHDYNNLYGCSNCMERETMSHKRLKPYCPNCGAKMKGVGEDA